MLPCKRRYGNDWVELTRKRAKKLQASTNFFVSVHWFQCHSAWGKARYLASWEHAPSLPKFPLGIQHSNLSCCFPLSCPCHSLETLLATCVFAGDGRWPPPLSDRTQPQCVGVMILLSVRCQRTFETAVGGLHYTPHWPLATATAVCISDVTRWKSLIN